MRRLLLHGSLRRWLTRIHRWSGLAMMACLLIASVTGVWLVFRVELDRLVNPHLRLVQPGPERLPLSVIVDRVEERFKNASMQTLILQERSDDAVGVYLRSRDGAPLEFNQVFVNPYTGAILGARSTSRVVFAREYVDPIIDRLHYSLLLETPGLWLMGIVAGAWLATSIVGLALAWPQLWLRAVAWAPILSARMNRSTYQSTYQVHRAVGVWLLPVLALLAFTSFYQNLPHFVRPLVNLFSPLTDRPAGRAHAPGEAIISPDQAIASLAARFVSAHPSSIGLDAGSGRYSILFHLPGDLSSLGDNWAFVDLGTGEVTGAKLAASASAGDRFLTWIFPLHTGIAFGLPGRMLIAIGGAGLIALLVTGFYVWWSKWLMRRRVRRQSRAGAVSATRRLDEA